MKQKHSKLKGFSLIELMVAMVIALIILLGLVSLFNNSSILNKAQSGLAVLQENGRYAILRIKQDIEQTGRKHCSSVALPSGELVTKWDQGYEMPAWHISTYMTPFNNGLPASDLDVDYEITPSTTEVYPVDPSFFLRGHECGTSCNPQLTDLGADQSVSFPAVGTGDGNLAANTDVLTIRYLKNGMAIRNRDDTNPLQYNLMEADANYSGPTLFSDCVNDFATNADWAGTAVTVVSSETRMPDLEILADPVAFKLDEDFKTVSYFVRIKDDPSRSGRKYSSLFRSENGNVQELVEGVERFDVFYLAQLNDGSVARMTADEVQNVSGSDPDQCIIPPKSDFELANEPGCLWRSIYAVEVHMLLNTVNDASMIEDEQYRYSVEGTGFQTPPPVLPNGLERERMYRKEFTAVVPVRSYNL